MKIFVVVAVVLGLAMQALAGDKVVIRDAQGRTAATVEKRPGQEVVRDADGRLKGRLVKRPDGSVVVVDEMGRVVGTVKK